MIIDIEAITESQMQEYKDQGWEVEEYNQDGFKGYMLSKKRYNLKCA